MLQNPYKTLGFMKNMVYKISRGGGKPYPASGLIIPISNAHLQITRETPDNNETLLTNYSSYDMVLCIKE